MYIVHIHIYIYICTYVYIPRTLSCVEGCSPSSWGGYLRTCTSRLSELWFCFRAYGPPICTLRVQSIHFSDALQSVRKTYAYTALSYTPRGTITWTISPPPPPHFEGLIGSMLQYQICPDIRLLRVMRDV